MDCMMAYASWTLSKSERNYDAHKLEFLALKWSVTEKFHKYLYTTFGNIYQKSYHCLCPHVDPHLSPPNAQQWVSMYVRPICVHIDHLEVLAGIEME